jgi:hypothetical protein
VAHTYSVIERECIVLLAAWNMIDGMVNYSIFHKKPQTEGDELIFSSSEASQLFAILLADFLSLPQRQVFGLQTGSGGMCWQGTFLKYLLDVCENPTLGANAEGLLKEVRGFGNWLDTEFQIQKVWLPSVDIETDITIKRIEFLKICGDFSKHGFLRLDVNVRRIKDVLTRSGIEVETQKGFHLMNEFCDWLIENPLAYHATTISEYLNNIRWEINKYLRDEFRRSYQKLEGDKYRYRFPDGCTNEFAQAMYWDLMNAARGKLYFPRFNTAPILTVRY